MTFTLATCKDSIWFRLNGKGLSISWDDRMLFSERNNLTKYYKIGKFKVKVLGEKM